MIYFLNKLFFLLSLLPLQVNNISGSVTSSGIFLEGMPLEINYNIGKEKNKITTTVNAQGNYSVTFLAAPDDTIKINVLIKGINLKSYKTRIIEKNKFNYEANYHLFVTHLPIEKDSLSKTTYPYNIKKS